jgi:hypothetical protein
MKRLQDRLRQQREEIEERQKKRFGLQKCFSKNQLKYCFLVHSWHCRRKRVWTTGFLSAKLVNREKIGETVIQFSAK